MSTVAAPPPAPPVDPVPPSAPEPAGPAGRVTRPTRSWAPTPAEWRDAGLLGAASVIALTSFQNTYGGTRYLVVGVVGLLAGMVLAHVADRRRFPAVVTAAVAVVVFLLLGGPAAVPEDTLFGVLPTPASVLALADGATAGWAKLLTTLPPVGSSAGLLTLPFLLGLLGGLLAVAADRRRRAWPLAALPVVTILVLGILFGTSRPVTVLVHGVVFASLLLVWASLRARDRRVGDLDQRGSRRWPGVVLTLVLAGAVAVVGAPRLPGADTHPRFVLRDRSQPPFDPREFPSPLSGYRRYTKADLLRNSPVLSVKGLDKGERLRIATLDSYDGVVYGVGSGDEASGVFRRAGRDIAAPDGGRTREVEVTVRGYQDVWVPTVGFLSGMEFDGPRAEQLQEAFRYNPVTGAAAAEVPLVRGDTYRFTAVEPVPSKDLDRLGPAGVQLAPAPPVGGIEQRVKEYLGPDGAAATPWARVNALVAKVKEEGRFSDGETADLPARPGHSVDRLQGMVDEGGLLVGNGEQYGPLLALMARQAQVPTRVAMGFRLPEDSRRRAVDLKGADVTVWLEVGLDRIGWVPLDDIVPTNTEQPQQQPRQQDQARTVTNPPPPLVVPSTEDDLADARKARTSSGRRDPGGGGIIGVVLTVGGVALVPVLAVVGVTALIGGLKSRRRRRRRTQGSATDRIAGGWDEISDLSADLGAPLPDRVTRHEAAAFIGAPAVHHLASHADARIFGPGEPSDTQVETYWAQVDETGDELTANLTRFERWRATVNLASFRRRAGRRRSRPGPGPSAPDGKATP